MAADLPLTGVSVLVVDDDEDVRDMTGAALRAAGADVRLAADGVEAMQVLQSERCDVVVSDVRMPRCDGLQLVKRMKAMKKVPGVVMMTGFFDVPTSTIMAEGVHAVLSKPFENAEVVRAVKGCLGKA